ncbi:Di-copper centre-containing protein [Sodiomyces alkalinus F11]|uniref:Di-copper centre-containing protein n=1 Tax=Sodiomyces alkalinus (strain CBS 110278 / VKM F-3762 / F11) TaxID=1314773 RepID=A0A3N2PTC8_SODAK|nr:Di-copper centre-containing protein [Sodiomyces alkalinus F11]ROT37760.1 Di-copper centre-containing protein [Sodiomyces alkalinus F11]
MELLLLLLLGFASLSVGEYAQEDIDSGKVLRDLSREAYHNAWARLEGKTEGCTQENVRVRKEWRDIPAKKRIDFVRAVNCLMSSESLNPDLEGARSRFDDFGVLHHQVSNYVHFSASFLLFHRYFTWAYEEALRNECAYEGPFPYWNWGYDAHDVESSPLFDGSATSLGSNGGCLIKGPFSNRTVNLGPGSGPDPYRYNPRCIRRDLNTAIASAWTTHRNTTDLILDSPNVELFQAIMQGDTRYPESRGLGLAVHGGGHFAIGGDPGGDFNWSPLEPAFYLHHGQVDRLYFIWQNLDWENRQNISGTATMYNRPPSDEQSLDDVMDITPLEEARTFRKLMDTIGETPFCFLYD